MLKKVNKLLFEFLWNGTDNMKKSVIVTSQIEGGLRMGHIENSTDTLKFSWLRRIITEKKKWHEILTLLYKTTNTFGKAGPVYVGSILGGIRTKYWKELISVRFSLQKIHTYQLQWIKYYQNHHGIVIPWLLNCSAQFCPGQTRCTTDWKRQTRCTTDWKRQTRCTTDWKRQTRCTTDWKRQTRCTTDWKRLYWKRQTYYNLRDLSRDTKLWEPY